MKKLLLFVLVFNLCFFVEGEAQSQTPSQTFSGGVQEAWVARYDEPGHANDFATAMVVDGSGNIYVTGSSGTVKYNSAGTQEWVANGSRVALAVDGSGNVYVTGSSRDSARLRDYATVKYNSAGTQQWTATYNGPGESDDRAVALAVDGAGNVYVTGSGDSYTYATVKYNSAGIQQWVATYKGSVDDDYRRVALGIDAAGNVYVTGSIDGKNADYATVKYNSAGTQEWVATYNGPGDGNDRAVALGVDRAGNVYVTGSSAKDSDYYTSYDYATVKYNSAGIQEWVKTNEGSPVDLGIDAAGNVYVTGSGGTVKYNSTGIQEWFKTYEGHPQALAVDDAGNVYVTGSRLTGTTADHHAYATVKYNSIGQEQWVSRYDYDGPKTGSDYPVALVLDGTGNVYVTGYSYGSGTGYDYVTIKYTQNPIADAGLGKTICAGGSIQIGGSPTGSSGHGGPYTFRWTPTTGLDDSTVPNPIASLATTTTYTVTVTERATGLSATDDVMVTVPLAGWSVAHVVDVDDVIFGIDQNATTPQNGIPRNNRGLALSPDERFLYLGYYNPPFKQRLVRKIDLNVTDDPAQNHRAVIAQLQLPRGTLPIWDIATDDRGRVYLALGTKIEIYNSNLQTPPLYTISGFTACEGLATRRENGKPVVYATDRLDKTLERFVLVESTGETITSSRKAGLDGDGEVRIVGAGSPGGLDVGKYGTAWIADLGRGKIYRVDTAGRTVDSTVVEKAMDVAIDTTRGEVYVSQYTLRTLKVLNVNGGKIKRTLTPPASDLKVNLKGETGWGALCGIAVASCARVYVANEKGRSILIGGDSPFSNVGDNNDVKAADTDPVLVVTGNGVAKESEEEVAEAVAVAVASYELEQNYPNPFSQIPRSAGNLSTKINFALPEATQVSLKIYDVAGQLVQTLADGVVQAGRHQVVWDGTNQYGVLVASGVYFYQLRAREFKQVRKMSLLR